MEGYCPERRPDGPQEDDLDLDDEFDLAQDGIDVAGDEVDVAEDDIDVGDD